MILWHRCSARVEEAEEIIVFFLLADVSTCSADLLLKKLFLNLSITCLGRRTERVGTVVDFGQLSLLNTHEIF